MPTVESKLPEDWARTTLKIQNVAGLREWNHNWVTSWDVSKACKERKESIIKLLEMNNTKLCVYFGQADRPESDKMVGRSMYNNNKLYIQIAKQHLGFINQALSYAVSMED